MKVINLARERMKRQQYKGTDLLVLLEVMTDFLEDNIMPITSKIVLKQGIDLFSAIYIQANTQELKVICSEYIKLYHIGYISL